MESTLVPLALFYGALWLAGVWVALLTALAWSVGAIAHRIIRRRPIPGLLALGAVGLAARTAVAFLTGSITLYFLQPTLLTVVIAGVFLLSVPAGRPLAERLAHDFCPLPEAFTSHDAVRRCFARITVLWAGIQLVNATATIWLLLTQPVGVYVVSKTALSWFLTIAGVIISTLHFQRSLRPHGLLVTRAGRAEAAPLP